MLASDLLRPGVLDGLRVAAHGTTLEQALALGAEVVTDDPAAFVADLRGAEGYDEALGAAWDAVRDAFHAGLRERGGIVVLIAPRPAGAWAAALRAALENTARTTSVEWARFGVRPVAVLPGPRTSDEEVDALVAWLLSPAGAYFSGCALTTR